MRIKLRLSAFRNLRLLNIGIGIMIRITSVATLTLKKAKLMVAILMQRPRSVTSQKALVGVHWKENTERNAMVVRVTTTSIPKQIRRINESKTRRY
jgi:DNA-binding winged helix-turn-helix (wHTH) protein